MMTREGPAMQEIDKADTLLYFYLPPIQLAFILFVTHDTPLP